MIFFKEQTINDAQGMPHVILEIPKCDLMGDPALGFGMKTAPTFAFRAHHGQKIITSQNGNAETAFECQGGEVVFVDRLPNGQMDVYVPRDNAGAPTGQGILKTGYKLVAGDLDLPSGALYQPCAAPVRIVHEAITQPTVILDAFGKGNHQFLDTYATLKLAGISVTGINKSAFDATWAITDKEGVVLRPARPPAPNFYSLERFQRVLGR